MKYTSTLRQNIKIAKNPHELYLIGCLQELDFNSKEHPKEHFSALDRFSDWSIDYKLLKKAFPVERDLRNFIDDFMYQFKGHTKNSFRHIFLVLLCFRILEALHSGYPVNPNK